MAVLGCVLGCSGGNGDADGGSPDARGPTGPVQFVFELQQDVGFFDRPFPLEMRRQSDGSPELGGYPQSGKDLIQNYIDLTHRVTNGFSPTGPVWMRFNGPLDAEALPTEPAATREPDSPVMLVDIDPDSPQRGRRFPARVKFQADGDSYRPDHLLQVLPEPGFPLREQTLYAVVVRTSIGSGDPERPLEPNPALQTILQGETPQGAVAEEVTEDYAPLRSWLQEQEIAPGEVAAATVYRTGDVTSQLFNAAEFAASQPAPEPVDGIERILEKDGYCGYAGEWEAPQYQTGTPPFEEEGGVIQWNDDGTPVQQRTERVPFVLAVPKKAMPAEGFPLLFYVNGTGGRSRQVLDRGKPGPGGTPEPGTGPAQAAAARGYGASGMAGPITPERVNSDAAMGGFAMYNVFNPAAMRDNFFQSIMEHVMFRKLVEDIAIDPSTCPGVDASAADDGMVHYDGGHRVVMGQSLGSHLSGLLATVDGGYQGAILSGAGASWIQFAFGVETPVNLTNFVELLVSLPASESLDRFHPVIALFDLAVGAADNIHYVKDMLDAPAEGHEAPHLMVIEGDQDQFIGPGLQRALIGALGIDLVGEDVGPPERQIEPVIRLAGRQVLQAPVSENKQTPSGMRTAGVVRYLPAAEDLGHYVAFHLDAPRHQYECFLQTLKTDGAPRIVARDSDSCAAP
jgi:hypothetical protein